MENLKRQEELILKLKKSILPLMDWQMREIEKGHMFYSPYESRRVKNGQKFRIVKEIYDDPKRRKAFGTKGSTAWIDDNGEIKERRLLDIEFQDGTKAVAELEELNGFYYENERLARLLS